MGAGRKPIPNEVKILQGTDQPCRMRDQLKADTIKNVLQIEDVRKIKTLHTARARNLFIARANAMIAMEILADVDMDQLAVYANTLELYEKASKSIAKEGAYMERTKVTTDKEGKRTEEVVIIANPYMKTYKGMIDVINKLGSEFGFSPVSRTKISTAGGEQEDELTRALRLLDGK